MTGLLDAAKLAAGALLGALAVYAYTQAVSLPAARSEGRALERAAAAAEAISRIQELEKNNETFRSLSPRDRCLALMRDSRLPDAGCD
ncbi:hypothetical protein [Shinella zoogloeoides]|uniref:hypothetical protein n=1 Tax=Shinella zoogloeoides TaxID=352475 RepID=UPI001F595FE1|nr:hypothetical protein [Shinella zoogloeoides]